MGAVVTDVRLAELTDAEWHEIEQAFHDHAVLVFPGQHLSADEQVAFARRFGEIEELFPGYDAVPISTVDRDGEVMAPDHPVMQVVRGNQGWHTDSTYMPVSAKASVLSAQVVPDEGGQTEWADMRAAYDDLDDATRTRIAELRAHHSIAYSQAKAGFDTGFGYGMDVPRPAAPAREGAPRHRAAGAVHRPPRPRDPGPRRGASPRRCSTTSSPSPASPRASTATSGTPGDVVVWDNRCVLHRACEWDLAEPRVMRHTRSPATRPPSRRSPLVRS